MSTLYEKGNFQQLVKNIFSSSNDVLLYLTFEFEHFLSLFLLFHVFSCRFQSYLSSCSALKVAQVASCHPWYSHMVQRRVWNRVQQPRVCAAERSCLRACGVTRWDTESNKGMCGGCGMEMCANKVDGWNG